MLTVRITVATTAVAHLVILAPLLAAVVGYACTGAVLSLRSAASRPASVTVAFVADQARIPAVPEPLRATLSGLTRSPTGTRTSSTTGKPRFHGSSLLRGRSWLPFGSTSLTREPVGSY